MQAPTEKKLKELDDINLLWLLRQVSLGNLARAFWRVVETFEPMAECVENCAKTQAAEITRCLEDDENENENENEEDAPVDEESQEKNRKKK